MDRITCIVRRPLLHRGARVEAGQHLELEPAEAAALVSTTRAELLHEHDQPRIACARQAETLAALRAAGRPHSWPVVDR